MRIDSQREHDLGVLLRAYIERQARFDRRGCPSFSLLEALIESRLQKDEASGIYEHLPRCRECLAELKALCSMSNN